MVIIMITCKCVSKFRDSNNKIIGYKLLDLNGKTQDIRSENLKGAIKRGEISVVNLTLTSDNRLVDKQSENSEAIHQKNRISIETLDMLNTNKVAKAFALIDKHLSNADNPYPYLVEDMCETYNIEFSVAKAFDNEKYAIEKMTEAYISMLTSDTSERDSIVTSIMGYYGESKERLNALVHRDNSGSLAKAIKIVYAYITKTIDKSILNNNNTEQFYYTDLTKLVKIIG